MNVPLMLSIKQITTKQTGILLTFSLFFYVQVLLSLWCSRPLDTPTGQALSAALVSYCDDGFVGAFSC